MFPDYKIRIIANACITRYTRGETDINSVADSYNLSEENRNAVMTRISEIRHDIT